MCAAPASSWLRESWRQRRAGFIDLTRGPMPTDQFPSFPRSVHLIRRFRRLDPTPPPPSHPTARPLTAARSAATIVVAGQLGLAEAATLCARLAALVEQTGADAIDWDLSGVVRPDAGTIDALGRVALASRRLGVGLGLRGVPADLRDLIALAGLGDVLPNAPGSGFEVERQAEQREQARGIEEERDPGDPPVLELEDL